MNAQNKFEKYPGLTLLAVVLLGILFVSCLGLLVMEFQLRAASPSVSFYDSRDGFRKYKPLQQFSITNEVGQSNSINTDRYGFRNPDSVYQQPGEKIILLGDSYVANINTAFEDNLSRQIENLCGIPVINAGLAGYSNFQMLQALNFLLTKVKARRVICFVYLGNDLRDNYAQHDNVIAYATRQSATVKPGLAKSVSASSPGLMAGFKNSLKASKALSWLYFTVYKQNFVAQKSFQFTSYFYGEAELYRDKPDLQFLSRALASTDRIVEMFAAVSRRKKLAIDFVLIPSKAQIERQFKFISKYNVTDDSDRYLLEIIREGYDFDAIRKHYHRILTRHGFAFLDLTEAYRERVVDNAELYYQVDMHWNAAGQRLAAEIVYKKVLSGAEGGRTIAAMSY